MRFFLCEKAFFCEAHNKRQSALLAMLGGSKGVEEDRDDENTAAKAILTPGRVVAVKEMEEEAMSAILTACEGR